MSKDSSSIRLVQQNASQFLANENDFESPYNQIPLFPSRAPLNSIPDPYQCQSKAHQRQFQHDSKEKPESSKPLASKRPETIPETQIVSSIIKTPRVYNRGKSANSEPNSAQSTTQIKSGPRLSNSGAASSGGCTIMRLPCQLGNIGGRGGIFPRVSRGISVALPEQLLADVPHFELDEDRRFWEDRNVQVLIRIRPLNNNEMILQGYGRCLRPESVQTVVWLGHPETRFTFDHIACESISQEKLFKVVGLPMVDNCMSGYNSCMFAYGQTGSGKTYTMMGETEKMDGKLNDGCGITPRIFEYLFTKITKEEESRKNERLAYSCKCSFLEIYNEQITDLLEPLSTNLQLREDSKKGVYVENLTEYSVRTVHDVLKLLQQGAANRKISATHMNSESSRSHSVFTCIIESRWEKDSMAHLRFGRLNLVDLAGSERQKSSGAEGDRLKEAANINKSLSTLGMVIMSLVDLAHGKHRHVPYRDSRLTFLLQDSLGGNSKTTIIANVSPATCSASETLSTLKFAQRAKLIQNNAKINEDASGDVIALQHQIQQLKGQLSFLMKHQRASMKLLAFAPSFEQSSLGFSPERSESSEEINVCGECKTPNGGIRKMKYFEATLHGALRREKLTEMEVRKLKAEIEQMNCLAHQRQEEAQRTKMILRFREEKIQRLESLSDGLISADKFYQDENNALREEIQHLHEKIDRNPEVNRFALENFRMLEQIRLFQDFYEQGERETLLAEISMLRNQLLELLEVEKCYARDQFLPMKGKQESEVVKESEQCKEMNSKLMREVDELQHQLGNSMNCNHDIFNSIETGLLSNNSIDEATVGNLQGDEADCDKNDQHILNLNGDNVQKQLMDAQSLLETFKLEQLHLNEELESVQAVNQQLVKMLDNKEIMERKLKDKCMDCNREIAGCKNHDPNMKIESNEGSSIMALQAKLDELSGELKEAQIHNSQFIKDRATWLSQDHQTELVRNEVEAETTKAIIHLQEEIDRLQTDFQGRLCSMAQQNMCLRKSVLDKEEELRFACSEWERAILDLTTFLIDGSRSLNDASHQIKSISCSFPNVSDWIGEHVERAAKICVEKEETIMLLQKSLEDAQKTVMQMEQKLHSLKGATVALTDYQQLEKSSSGEEIQLSGMSDDLIYVREFPENKPMSEEDQITDNLSNAALLVENVLSDYSKSTLRGNVDGNMALPHKNAYATADVNMQIESSMQILLKTEDAVNDCCLDANMYLSALKSDIHNTVSLYKELVQGLIKDVSDLRKDIMELKGNQGSLQFFTGTIPSRALLKHESQLQMLRQIRNELAGVNNRLSSMSACFHRVMNMHCCLDSSEALEEIDEWTTDYSNSCSNSSLKCVDNDDKSSSSDHFTCSSQRTEQILDSKSDEESDLSCNTAGLFFRMEFAKAYAAFVKLKDELMAVTFGETNQSCVAEVLAFSAPNALENCNKQCRSGRDQSTSQRVETGSKKLGQFGVEENCTSASNFLTQIEEAYVTMKDADCMLKAMLKANENANMMTAMWKQSGEKLMADKESLSKEIKYLKSCILLRDGENEALHDQIQFNFTEIANILSLLEEFFLQMQTGLEELFKAPCIDATQVVEETRYFSCSSRSCLENLLCKALQNDVSMFVLQCQIGEYLDKIKRMNRTPQHSSITSNLGMGHKIWEDNFAFQPVKCESEGDQIADDAVNKISELMRELEQKEILLEGLLFDFSLLQELASQRKDIKDEIEKLVVASSKVQHELQIKTVQLDDVLVQNTKLEGSVAEAELALFNSNSELNQAKQTLDSLFERNVDLKILLKDLYLKNSEVEQLLVEQKETIKYLEEEIIRASSSPQIDSIPSTEDIEDALKRVTIERDQLLEKLCSLQDRLDMACAIADENQAIAAEAHQESEASKMYAEQKEEEVKILERSVEELESTINVLEEKVHEMEEEVEKHRVIRDSLELELQALRHRLSTVEDFTESMSSENSNAALHEDKILRKLHIKSLEINESHNQIRFLEAKNAEQAKEIKQFKGYISELVLHAEAQASQYQQKYKNLEAMVREVKTDLSNVSATSTLDRADKISTKTRGSSSPFRCIGSLVQQLNQEKDQELSNARLHIEELETLAASRHKEVCMLNTRLATAESMTHDVIRDLLSVKLDITNYANIIDQHQVQKLIEEAQHHQQEFAAMEQEIANMRSHIDDLLEERERCISEVNRCKADLLSSQIILEQLQERDQMLLAQNDMLKMDKCNLQKRVVELDEMVKKLFKMQDSQPRNQQQMSRQSIESDLDKRLEHSQKVLSRINDEFAQYRNRPDAKLDSRSKETQFR